MNKFSKVKVKVKSKQRPSVRQHYQDKQFKVQHHKCDLCDDRLECNDDIESYIDMKEDINNSYESPFDKQEPKLLLCHFCKNEYNIPSWIG